MAKGKASGGKLIIVESPTKAKTIKQIVGKDFAVESTMGHVRDLPERKMGVDIKNGFKPQYVLIPKRQEVIQKLKGAAAKADEVYLATDPDREGEAIAWHIAHALNLDSPRRIEFHEITKNAVLKALQSPRSLDMNLVNAQQARRVLDRLFGYTLSPLLSKKIRSKLSAGRVQSVALRLVCEREREIQNFVPQEYWSIIAHLTPQEFEPFEAKLIRKGSQNVVSPNDKKSEKDLVIRSYEEAQKLSDEILPLEFKVSRVERTDKRRSPPPPFITSTLQQEASRKLGFSPSKTMQVAQQLYEGVAIGSEGQVGLITYMRTDSPRIAPEAQQAARRLIAKLFGSEFLPEKPRFYRSRRGAQEAHECIRPTSITRTPDSLNRYLNQDQLALYELIWKRFVACQMADAIYDSMTVDIQAGDPSTGSGLSYLFRARGQKLKFAGFLAVYQESEEEEEEEEEETALPLVSVGEVLQLLALAADQHFTQPPYRYTQASLVKALEQHGIGRPSTYAPIISTIIQRGYVETRGKVLFATELGMLVNDRLIEFFPDLINVKFTADMEDRLDFIEEGRADWVEVVKFFYQPFEEDLKRAQEEMEKVKAVETDKICPLCGAPMVVRYSRYGRFYGCSKYPKCKGTLSLEDDKKKGAEEEEVSIPCPMEGCGGHLVRRVARKGKLRGRSFYGCSNYPNCTFTLNGKPTGEKCPKCGSLLVGQGSQAKMGVGCSNAKCSYGS